jgi:hypothetical protein
LYIGLAYYPAGQLVAQLVAGMRILLTFIATPSRASHSRAVGTWSSNLNTLTTLSVAQIAVNKLAALAAKLVFSIRFTVTNVLASVPVAVIEQVSNE